MQSWLLHFLHDSLRMNLFRRFFTVPFWVPTMTTYLWKLGFEQSFVTVQLLYQNMTKREELHKSQQDHWDFGSVFLEISQKVSTGSWQLLGSLLTTSRVTSGTYQQLVAATLIWIFTANLMVQAVSKIVLTRRHCRHHKLEKKPQKHNSQKYVANWRGLASVRNILVANWHTH